MSDSPSFVVVGNFLGGEVCVGEVFLGDEGRCTFPRLENMKKTSISPLSISIDTKPLETKPSLLTLFTVLPLPLLVVAALDLVLLALFLSVSLKSIILLYDWSQEDHH